MNEAEKGRNVSELSNMAAVREQAAAWLVRIDSGELSADEKIELRQWASRRQCRQALVRLACHWDAMARLQDLAEIFPLPEMETGAHVAGSNRLRPVARFAAAAVLLVALVAGLGMFPDLWRTDELSTSVGEQASFTLKDGSVISLNTNTRLRVDYSAERRALTLVQGEATFDVAKNPERPFVVYAGGGMVWAVGTAFNVRFLDEEVDVTVTEGRVKVFSDTGASAAPVGLEVDDLARKPEGAADSLADGRGTEALIGAGETLRYSKVIKTVAPIPDEALSRKLAWREGSLIFKGESLDQAMAEIARYTDREIVIKDQSLRTISVGGHYKTDDIDALFNTLEQGLDIRIESTKDNQFVVTSMR